jgi:hypothetical protein
MSSKPSAPAAIPSRSHPTHCAICRTELPPPSPLGGRPRRTCSVACRDQLAFNLVYRGVAEREHRVKELAELLLAVVRQPLPGPTKKK